MKAKTAKIGRPFKMNQVNLDQVEVIASLGLIDEEIAIVLGISRRTLNYWKKKPDFLHSLKRGKLKADFQVTKSLYEKAKAGDVGAIIFWLKNRRPDLWRDRQHIDGNLNIRAKMSMAELRKSVKGFQDADAGE